MSKNKIEADIFRARTVPVTFTVPQHLWRELQVLALERRVSSSGLLCALITTPDAEWRDRVKSVAPVAARARAVTSTVPEYVWRELSE